MPRLWNFRPRSAIMQSNEALGVTAGAVYKWESRLSLPELPMLVQLADFFDTSVDALIGYTIKDNRRDATLARLMDLRPRQGSARRG